jgi:hypothetical protein
LGGIRAFNCPIQKGLVRILKKILITSVFLL